MTFDFTGIAIKKRCEDAPIPPFQLDSETGPTDVRIEPLRGVAVVFNGAHTNRAVPKSVLAWSGWIACLAM